VEGHRQCRDDRHDASGRLQVVAGRTSNADVGSVRRDAATLKKDDWDLLEDVMRYRLLGRSGLLVSEICLGTMTYGRRTHGL